MRLNRAVSSLLAFSVLVGLFAGCSDDSGEEAINDSSSVAVPTVPSSNGDSCTDPTGDVDAGNVGDQAVLDSLSGIDIVEASARPNGDKLDVSFVMAGPVALVPNATYAVAQGVPLDPLSFELRIMGDAGTWQVMLIRWSPDEQRRVIDVPVTVDENRVSTSILLDDLPSIALMLQFGAGAEVQDAPLAIDDCSSLTS